VRVKRIDGSAPLPCATQRRRRRDTPQKSGEICWGRGEESDGREGVDSKEGE